MTRSSCVDMVSLLAGCVFVAGCGGAADAPSGAGRRSRGDMRFPVEVQPVQARRLDYLVSAVGAVDAFERVQVAARVAGAIERVAFAEGEHVAKGQALVYIDTERYGIAVQAAQAALQRAEAALVEAQTGLKRRSALVAERPDLIPAEELDSWSTKAQVAAAQVAEARAAMSRAELDRRYATPSAPAAGIIETRTVETGQYVQLGTQLATLVRRDPLLLKFKVTEADTAALKVGMPAGFTVGQSAKQYSARITHVGQSADGASRMVSVTAEVDDPRKEELRPGTFAQVSIVVGARESAPVVPQIAVRPCERGFVSYVVEGEVARERVVQLGMRTADGYVEVQKGLVPGEMVVVRGAEALADGAKVAPRPLAAALAGPASATGSTTEPKAKAELEPKGEAKEARP